MFRDGGLEAGYGKSIYKFPVAISKLMKGTFGNKGSGRVSSHAPLRGIFAPRQGMHLASSRKTPGIFDFQPGTRNTKKTDVGGVQRTPHTSVFLDGLLTTMNRYVEDAMSVIWMND